MADEKHIGLTCSQFGSTADDHIEGSDAWPPFIEGSCINLKKTAKIQNNALMSPVGGLNHIDHSIQNLVGLFRWWVKFKVFDILLVGEQFFRYGLRYSSHCFAPLVLCCLT